MSQYWPGVRRRVLCTFFFFFFFFFFFWSVFWVFLVFGFMDNVKPLRPTLQYLVEGELLYVYFFNESLW